MFPDTRKVWRAEDAVNGAWDLVLASSQHYFPPTDYVCKVVWYRLKGVRRKLPEYYRVSHINLYILKDGFTARYMYKL